MRKWYLVYSRPRQERIAMENLERQGYESYLPLIKRHRRRQGRRVVQVEPMFPRYLFICLDTQTDNWAPIRSTRGVNRLVRFGLDPAVVPMDLLEILKARENEEGVQNVSPVDFRHGDRVRISEGPLMGYEGIFLAKSSQERVTILLNVVNKQMRIKANPAQLETA
ncbi:MAG: transcription/translation regulatory transformer protein RfaH [Gammaproteobacteria bacterium]|nr:transcription/translation regulatory transformer protein RfaH [Gammaproteobacteria bacterium]